jgi:hypothetical protein
MAKLEMPIRETIQAYCRDTAGEHDRDRSWEHCYRYFKLHSPEKLAADRSHAALQLGFYLASWGMYRGSCFLLKYAYTAHLGVIEQLAAPEFTSLWQHEFGPTEDGRKLIPVILASVTAIREAYRPFAPNSEDRQASDTLVTKILLGTFGCFPACDRYFIDGTKSVGLKGPYVNSKLIEDLLAFWLSPIPAGHGADKRWLEMFQQNDSDISGKLERRKENLQQLLKDSAPRLVICYGHTKANAFADLLGISWVWKSEQISTSADEKCLLLPFFGQGHMSRSVIETLLRDNLLS